MTILTFLADLARRGLSLRPNGEKINCTPRELLTDADRQFIVENRNALLKLLALRDLEAQRASGGDVPPLVIVRAWQEAKAACPDFVVTIEGDLIPKTFHAGAQYDPQFAADHAQTTNEGEPSYLAACITQAGRKADNGALLPPLVKSEPRIPVALLASATLNKERQAA